MNREKILDIATIAVLLLAGGVGGLTAWDRFIIPVLERRPVRVDNWESLSRTGHLLRDEGPDLVVLEFGDYQCPACRHFEAQLEAFAAAHPRAVTVRFRHWPLPQHAVAYRAAAAAECAAVQGYFPAFHKSLMNQTAWMEAPNVEFMRIATAIGVPDSVAFGDCMEAARDSSKTLETDIEVAKTLGGRGTPTLVINGFLLREIPDSAGLEEMLARASTSARTNVEGQVEQEVFGEAVGVYVHAGGFVSQEVPVWRLSAAPTLSLGKLEGPPEETFGFVSGAVQMSDGTIAVVDLSSAEVIMFDAEGSHLRTVGGEGDGPTELRGPLLLPATDYDSLVVFGNGRISVVRTDGVVYPAGRYEPRDLLRGVLPSGVVYEWSFDLGRRVSTSGPRLSDVEVGVLSLPSEDRRVLGRYSYYHTYFEVEAGRQRAYPMPLRSAMNLAPTRQGVRMVVGNEHVIRLFDLRGKPLESVPLPLPRRRVTADHIRRAIEAEIARRPHQRSDRFRQVLEQEPYPEFLPVVKRMLPDGDGGVWMELTREYVDGEANWIAMDAMGEMVARVRVPSELDLSQIGRDFVIGTSTDELGVQRVHRFGLIRTTTAGNGIGL